MKQILLILIATTTLAHANLIDRGTFDLTQPFPQVLVDFFAGYGGHQQNIAGVNLINGQLKWSPFTIFNTDHFSLTLDGSTSWNLSGTGWRLAWVFVEGFNNGTPFAELFSVRGKELFEGNGDVFIDNGNIPWLAVTFVGRTGVPDTGSTLVMLSGAVVIVILLSRMLSSNTSDGLRRGRNIGGSTDGPTQVL